MSEVENKPVVADPVEPTVAEAAVEPLAPTTGTDVEAAKPEVEAPAVEAAAPAAEESKEEQKTIEPVTEGQLSHKGPGLVKSLIPSKKEFWLSDEAVAPENLDLYLRGEKPEVAHAVVAWASQTGKGLLFSTKKNADRAHPTDVFALYDATDLKKQSPHEFSFKLNGHNHSFKAANDTERDGWYVSIEKAIELGKASKEEITGSESYKTETDKLTKPAAVAGAAAAGTAATAAAAKSTESEETAEKDAKKTRTKSPFARFSRKKEEVAEKEEEQKTETTEEATPALASTEQAPVSEAVAASSIPAAAEAAEKKDEETVAPVEEKPKPAKRQSIFGKLMSPSREKGAKEAELKEPSKDAVVSENPPVLPETTTEPAVETAVPVVTEPSTEAAKEAETATPTKERSNFLTSFMKRNRSVSPSTALSKETPKTEEVAVAAPAAEETVVAEPAKATEQTEADAEPTVAADEETKKETTPNKRQSVLGSLGRRASKALNRMQAPKKENTPAATETKEEAGTTLQAENPVVSGTAPEVKPEEEEKKIGDVVPEAVNVGQTQPVTASA